jgi:hypothetical protein
MTKDQFHQARKNLVGAMRLAIMKAVGDGMDPVDAAAAAAYVAAWCVAAFDDDAQRFAIVEATRENFGPMVELARSRDDQLVNAMLESMEAVRQ